MFRVYFDEHREMVASMRGKEAEMTAEKVMSFVRFACINEDSSIETEVSPLEKRMILGRSGA